MAVKNYKLEELPNIGKILAEKLSVVGIESIDVLQAIGSENAFIKLKTIDSDACLNQLCAIEGAIQGVRWHNLDESRKRELKEFYNVTKQMDRKILP